MKAINMKKIILLGLLGMLCPALSWADDATLCFAVVGIDGSETYFAVDEDPLVSYANNTMTVTSSSYTLADVRLDDVEMCYFLDTTPTDIGSISIGAKDESAVNLNDGKVLVTGLLEGAQVYVYTAGGQTIISVQAQRDGNVCVDLNNFKRGQVYILRTPSTSFKIIK